MKKCNRTIANDLRSTLKELPYFNFTGDLAAFHGQTNNSVTTLSKSKRNLDRLPGLYDLDLFSLNSGFDQNFNPDNNLINSRIQSRYFSPHSFNILNNKISLSEVNSSFSIFHNNVVSLKRNLENVLTLLDELDFHFDVIAVTETKITNSNVNEFYPNIPGYCFECVPTPLASGGVGMFIEESLNYNVLEKTSTEAFQALWIEISFVNSKNIICGIIYRQHNSPEFFQSYFEETVERLASTNKNVYVFGDFNIDLLKCETSKFSHEFFLTLQSCYLIPTIDKPTRVHRNSATLIDNIFVNTPDRIIACGNIISDISDHFSQFCIVKSAKDNTVPKTVKMRDFSKFCADRFNSDLAGVQWDNILIHGQNDVNKMFSSFYNKFTKVVNKHAPIKRLSRRRVKELSKPWITAGLKTSIRVRYKLYASGDEFKYKYYRNKICSLIRLSKSNYYHQYFERNMSDMKKIWNGINELLYRRKKNFKKITAVKDRINDNAIVRETSKISNIMNEHFASVGSRLADKLLSSRGHFLDYVSNCKSPSSSFFFQPITPQEVKLEISSIPINKSYGLYSSPTKLLKLSKDIIAPVISELFNISVKSGTYPSKLKMSKITPIFKTDDETDPNNYRPISLLSNYNRIFEKIMYKRMIDFIEKNDLLYSSQYGFRKGHSTQHAILDIVNTIQTNMSQGLFSCGIFIDLKKAFDTVDHDILLSKLYHYGFRGIVSEWFASYLKNRVQTTQISEHISSKAKITCGVPQGSVLGPLLFLLYVNDMYQCSNKFNFYLFADDTNILYANKNLKTLEVTVNAELRNLCDWLTSNKLSLNINKSNFVLFHHFQKRANYSPNICIFDNENSRNVSLKSKDYIKYLGVVIDKNLSWKFHIDAVATKISKIVGLIAKLRHFTPRRVLLNIYQALIQPYLTYGLASWGQSTKANLNKILILQKRALRLIYFAHSRAHAIPLFTDANVLPLTFLYYESVSNLMYDVNNNNTPSNISKLFQKPSVIHSYNTRSSTSGNFYVQSSSLEIQKRSFSRFGVKLWNEIPQRIRNFSKKAYKREIRGILSEILVNENDYIETPIIVKKVGLIK